MDLCVLYIPIPGAVSLPRRDTQFSRMRSKTNILSPGVTSVGGEHSLVAPRSGSVPKLVVTFEFLWPEAFWCAELCSLKPACRHCSPESPGFRTRTPLRRRGPDLSVQKGLSPHQLLMVANSFQIMSASALRTQNLNALFRCPAPDTN